jgi:hypothetical protein
MGGGASVWPPPDRQLAKILPAIDSGTHFAEQAWNHPPPPPNVGAWTTLRFLAQAPEARTLGGRQSD